MYGNVGFKDSYVPGNGYQFHCPVVDRDALFIACIFMRKKYMQGKSFVANDCRCAMSGSKCPATRMLEQEWRKGERLYYDAQPTKHMLPKEIIAAIEKVALLPSQAGNFPLTSEQAARLFAGGLKIARVAGGKTLDAPPDETPVRRRAAKLVESPDSPESVESVESPGMIDAIAGMSDMGDMLNKSLETELGA